MTEERNGDYRGKSHFLFLIANSWKKRKIRAQCRFGTGAKVAGEMEKNKRKEIRNGSEKIADNLSSSPKTMISKSKTSILALLSLIMSLFGIFFVFISSIPHSVDTQLKVMRILFPFGSNSLLYVSFFAPYLSPILALIALAKIRQNLDLKGKRIAITSIVISYLWMLLYGIVYFFFT
ncbi:MAG: DUF4190 domain-containing protein [Planctomycetes bacterium]|nr:DUF4190 domain-containing protein [Planctomycetota bacterium]